MSKLSDATEQAESQSRPSSTTQSAQLRQSVKDNAAELVGHRQREARHAASTRKDVRQNGVAEEVSPDRAGIMTAEPIRELPELSPEDSTPAISTAQINKPDQATGSSEKSASSQSQTASADLSALRQLLAEATAIASNENGQVRADRKRRETLDSLGKLSAAMQFAPGSKVVDETMEPILRQIEQILADYPETRIIVTVATNEHADDEQDVLLSQERGRTLIARLVNEGLAFSRISLEALSGDQLPANSHRVGIQARPES